MTKIETKIAEENIGKKGFFVDKVSSPFCKEHKASCQRFFGSLLSLGFCCGDVMQCGRCKRISDKITDLKNAIKKYDEAGI